MEFYAMDKFIKFHAFGGFLPNQDVFWNIPLRIELSYCFLDLHQMPCLMQVVSSSTIPYHISWYENKQSDQYAKTPIKK